MSGIPFVYDLAINPEYSLWDQMYLGGVYWPGVWSIGASKKRSLDIVKVRRKDGTMTLDNGYFGAELTAYGRLWTPAQFDELQEILPNFDPQRPGGGRTPLDLYHPAAALLSCNTVYLQSLAVPPLGGSGGAPRGSIIMTIDMVQWCSDLKIFVQGFAGARKANAPINASDFELPSANTGSKL